jgi:hypothetical protein
MLKRTCLALAATALLVACGGGDSASNAVTPQAAKETLRMKALAVSSSQIPAAEVARQLMDFAETSEYKSFFPGHPTTQSWGPFLYRAYSNGVLLGVASGDNSDYADGVYVMGGPFGDSPAFKGPVTAFITPVDPNAGGGGTTGSNNGCYDLSFDETPGGRIVIDFAYTGTIGGNENVDTLVGNLTTFEGNSAREIAVKTTGTHTSAAGSLAVNTDNKVYLKKTGDAEVTQYGALLSSSSVVAGFSLTTTAKTVWSPPWVDKQYGLALGASYTYSQTGTVTSTTPPLFPGLPATTTTTPVSVTQTLTYVGRESVTVPAGTYNACKFRSTTAGNSDVTTQWVVVSKGVPVQTITTNAAGTVTQTIQATSITLNGQKL